MKQEYYDWKIAEMGKTMTISPGCMWGVPALNQNANASSDSMMGVEPQQNVGLETTVQTLRGWADWGSGFVDSESEPMVDPPRPRSNLFGRAPLPLSLKPDILPMEALSIRYNDETNVQLTKEAYFYWQNDQGQWTCALVCPETYEIFPSGRFETTSSANKTTQAIAEDVDDETVELVWYPRKKDAGHGAAALAFDCFYYRQWFKNNPDAPKFKTFGLDDPYLSVADDKRATLVKDCIPESTMKQIDARKAKWSKAAAERASQEERRAFEQEQEAMMVVEDTEGRNAYLEARAVHQPDGGDEEDYVALD